MDDGKSCKSASLPWGALFLFGQMRSQRPQHRGGARPAFARLLSLTQAGRRKIATMRRPLKRREAGRSDTRPPIVAGLLLHQPPPHVTEIIGKRPSQSFATVRSGRVCTGLAKVAAAGLGPGCGLLLRGSSLPTNNQRPARAGRCLPMAFVNRPRSCLRRGGTASGEASHIQCRSVVWLF